MIKIQLHLGSSNVPNYFSKFEHIPNMFLWIFFPLFTSLVNLREMQALCFFSIYT